MASDVMVTFKCSTWRFNVAVYLVRFGMAVLPLRWAHLLATWFLDALEKRDGRLLKFLVRASLRQPPAGTRKGWSAGGTCRTAGQAGGTRAGWPAVPTLDVPTTRAERGTPTLPSSLTGGGHEDRSSK
jgi:hypothetical protein